MTNYGLDLEKEKLDRSEEDYIFGSGSLTGLADKVAGLVIALHAWPSPINGIYPRVIKVINHCVCFFSESIKKYFPLGEIQRGVQDFMDCVTRGHNNEIEKQLNYIVDLGMFSDELVDWLTEKGYITDNGLELSDRFPAMLSNTSRNGNSMKAPIQAILDHGCIPKSMLPANSSMTWDAYHNKDDITDEMLELGKEWIKRIKINYEIVYDRDFSNFSEIKWEIFDNYIDRTDGDYVKRLAPNYKLMNYGYKILINEIIYKSMSKTLAKLGKDKNSNGLSIILPQTSEEALYANLLNHNIEFETKGKPHTVDFGSLKIDAEIDFKDGVVASQKTFMEKLLDLFTK